MVVVVVTAPQPEQAGEPEQADKAPLARIVVTVAVAIAMAAVSVAIACRRIVGASVAHPRVEVVGRLLQVLRLGGDLVGLVGDFVLGKRGARQDERRPPRVARAWSR